MAQEGYEQLGRDGVVVGEAAAIGQVIVFGVEAQALDEFAHGFQTIFGMDVAMAGGLCSQTGEQGLGIEVVALFHHLLDHILHRCLVAGH